MARWCSVTRGTAVSPIGNWPARSRGASAIVADAAGGGDDGLADSARPRLLRLLPNEARDGPDDDQREGHDQAPTDQHPMVLESVRRGNQLLEDLQDPFAQAFRQVLHGSTPFRSPGGGSGGSIPGQAVLSGLPGDGGLGDAEMLGRARLGPELGEGVAEKLGLDLLTGLPQARP